MKFNKTMKIKSITSILLLSMIIGTLVLGIPSRGANIDSEPQTAGNYLEPISILIYTEYADMTPNQEYNHTIEAIDSYYGTNYNYKQLKDYTKLSDHLSDYDVFLIPEQENTPNTSIMNDIGNTWETDLNEYTTNGGIVICLDFLAPTPSYLGITRLLLNYSGLMNFEGSCTIETGNRIYLNASNDALACGINSSWTALDGTISAPTSDGTVVVDDANNRPVVVHKTLGEGHVVYCGFDFFNIEANCGKIVANALRLARSHTPFVLFDDSHSNTYDIGGSLSYFAEDLLDEGFGVLSMETFRKDLIESCDIFVICTAEETYNSSEIEIIHNYVKKGNALFVATDWGEYGDELDGIIETFGFTRNKTGRLSDSDEYDGDIINPIFDNENLGGFLSKRLTMKLRKLTAFTTIPSGTQVLISTDNDATSTWYTTSTPAKDLPVAVALDTSSGGRVAMITDTVPMINSYYDSVSHKEFMINTFIWLSKASYVPSGSEAIPGFPLELMILTVMISCTAILIFIYKKRI